MGLLNGAIPYWLIAWGEQSITSGLASLLQATMPIFTVLMAHRLSADEHLTWLKVGGVVVGFAGVGILMLPDLLQGLRANVLGQLAIVVSSICYAGATLFARQRLRGISPLVATTGQLTMGMVFTVPASLVLDWPFPLAVSLPAIGSWLGLTLLGTVVAYVIYYALIERTSATFVSTVTYIIPVNGLLLGAAVLGEPLSATLLGSLALILLGIALVRS
jgi:drug/metabolite transporter (DMT)-like permease